MKKSVKILIPFIVLIFVACNDTKTKDKITDTASKFYFFEPAMYKNHLDKKANAMRATGIPTHLFLTSDENPCGNLSDEDCQDIDETNPVTTAEGTVLVVPRDCPELNGNCIPDAILTALNITLEGWIYEPETGAIIAKIANNPVAVKGIENAHAYSLESVRKKAVYKGAVLFIKRTFVETGKAENYVSFYPKIK